ncbi:dephospho-CoA kinase [Bacillus halotolerans]|uniref:Dephospho-CoA kinase n=1 Tax=Bacillus halotolerans TaxID=260554 RepID=A0A9Q6AAS2_9BACI|nr:MULTISPECIES: dephospho-CoA kinase [Bacillus]MBV7318464.1 dephospho-CoA kinase [Halalkalibacterium halodurans]AZV50571.1 dephospho-CoA kinase [Bacillus halotolerans]MCP9300102.1 dephospho-CoA kinase [Bacillus halotolerans]MCV0022648.1 dephospho-CoA kinase [Bacillus sp. XT-2]MCY8473427.1 dephospho-CoA kinase [Bacillus halotolerans]
MTLVIGLTGGIASGKSTVANMLIDKGITVIDADIIAKQAVEKGMPAYRQIIDEFGEDILLENGDIDRRKLGALVFTNEQKRLALNSIVHPAVREEMLKRRNESIANQETFVVLDIPLLFESKLESLVDKIIVVSVTKELQLERLTKRNQLTEEEALSRIRSQIPLEEKVSRADNVIDNSGTLEETKQQLEEILSCWA